MSMAVADCVVLLASVPNEILYYYLVGNLWIWGDVGCAGFIFFQNLGINASSLSLVAFTVERYIAICHPLKAHTVCTLSRARRIVYGVWVFATVYCCPWLGLTTTRLLGYKGYPGARSCDFKLPRHHYLAYFFADLVVFYVLPLIVSCVLYGLITRVLFTRRFGVNKSNNRLQGNATASKSSSKDQVVKMLAMVVFVFATLWLPYRGMLVYNSFAMLFSRKRFMDLWFLMFAKTCIYINCAINPILYSMMSAKFRRAFHRVLCGTARLNNYDTPYTSTRNFSTSTRSSSRKHCSRSSSMSMKKTSGFKRGTSERNRSTLHTATTAC